MTDPARGVVRVARAGVVGVTCTLLALAGHVVGGGAAPPVVSLVAVGAVATAAFVFLAGRRLGFWQLLAGTLGSQAGFHGAFLVAHGEHMPTFFAPAMTAGHLAAACVTAWVLAHGEDTLWTLVGLFALVRVPSLVLVPVAAGPRPASPCPQALPAPYELLLSRLRGRRGPPLP